MSDFSDERVWRAVVAGNGEGFGRVWDRHAARVRRHAIALVQRPADVDDAVAVVFLQAWRRRNSVRFVEGSMLPWLLVTTTHVCQNVERSRRRHSAMLARLPVVEDVPDHAERLVDGDAGAALRRLSLLDQEILTLCVVEAFTEQEAATALGVRPGTVKSRLHRARRRLADQFQTLTTTTMTTEGRMP